MSLDLDPGDVTVVEHVVRRSALALSISDMGTGEPVSDGIVVTAWRANRPDVVLRAGPPTTRGIAGFTRLPGLADYEDGSTARAEWFAVPPAHAAVGYIVRVVDTTGAHLPAVLAVSAPQAAAMAIALPPSPTKAVPGGWIAVFATAVDDVGLPASWAVVELDVAGYSTGGVCDATGLVTIAVPRATTPTTLGTPSSGPVWTATATVRFRRGDQAPVAGAAADDPPSLASILGQQAASVREGAATFQASVQRGLSGSSAVIASVDPPQAGVPTVLVVRPVP